MLHLYIFHLQIEAMLNYRGQVNQYEMTQEKTYLDKGDDNDDDILHIFQTWSVSLLPVTFVM